MRRREILVGTMPLALGLAGGAAAYDVTRCGAVVPDGELGVLQQDLSCPSYGVVSLGSGSSLELNGYTLEWANPAGGGYSVVDCSFSRTGCTVRGPGTIRCIGGGFAEELIPVGVRAPARGTVVVEDVVISGCSGGITDIRSDRLTRVVDVTCGRSSHRGICAND